MIEEADRQKAEHERMRVAPEPEVLVQYVDDASYKDRPCRRPPGQMLRSRHEFVILRHYVRFCCWYSWDRVRSDRPRRRRARRARLVGQRGRRVAFQSRDRVSLLAGLRQESG